MEKIGIITLSKSYDSHIARLRKRNINAIKLTTEADYSSCTILILDLCYPLEKAFIVLEELSTNYIFAEIKVLLIIENKSDIHRITRASALRADGYISSKISFEFLISKIDECRHKNSVLKKRINNGKMAVEVDGLLTHISETGGLIRGPVLLNRNSDFQIRSIIFKQLGIEDEIICKATYSNPIPIRLFNSEISFLNISDRDRDHIRETIAAWNIN